MSEVEVVIASACRTPVGSLQGALSGMPAPALGSVVIRDAIKRTGITEEQVDEVIFGQVLSAGVGQAPARQAALGAGLPDGTPCTTINKMCGSGLQAVIMASHAIRAGEAEIMVAGGMENMSLAPYLLDKARSGYRLGHGKLIDSMINDGLWDVYNDVHMGNAAEMCASQHAFSREQQDAYAIRSYERAQSALRNGTFAEEIVAVVVSDRHGDTTVNEDEEPANVRFEKIPGLRPVFEKAGTITAANASTLNDGASACVVMNAGTAKTLGVKPLARIVGQISVAKEPVWFTTAPVDAITALLKKTGLSVDDIDLFEINEAFAVVPMAVIKELALDEEKVNVNGGAIALGHPIGASGARILTTLLYALKQRDKKRGLATLCIGGGEATAIIVELL